MLQGLNSDGALLCAPWAEPALLILGVVGTWLLAFGLAPFKRFGGDVFFDTSRPAVTSWKFWLGLGLITAAGLAPAAKYFWALCPA